MYSTHMERSGLEMTSGASGVRQSVKPHAWVELDYLEAVRDEEAEHKRTQTWSAFYVQNSFGASTQTNG